MHSWRPSFPPSSYSDCVNAELIDIGVGVAGSVWLAECCRGESNDDILFLYCACFVSLCPLVSSSHIILKEVMFYFSFISYYKSMTTSLLFLLLSLLVDSCIYWCFFFFFLCLLFITVLDYSPFVLSSLSSRWLYFIIIFHQYMNFQYQITK